MLDYYVYALFREDGSPFYIGKGNTSRFERHERQARSGEGGPRFDIIRDMQTRGIEVPKVKIHEGLTEHLAYQYESALIAAIGREPSGPLVNLTDGGAGCTAQTRAKGSKPGRPNWNKGGVLSRETRAKMAAAARNRWQRARTQP